jgi:undecaprenyl pyrophosphate synthase
MKEFGNSLKELEPGFSTLNTKYPKLLASKSKLPSDLLDKIGASEANSKRLTQITLLSLYRYGSEPDVAVSVEELKSAIMSIDMKLSR